MSTLFIDIETIRCQREDLCNELAIKVQAPSNYKDADKIQAYRAAQMDTVIDKTPLDGTFGEIVCIGYALDDGEVQTMSRKRDNTEATILYQFMEGITQGADHSHPKWVGHNVGFDLRFLWHGKDGS